MPRLPLIAALAGLTALSACQSKDVVLPGERLDPRAVISPDGGAVDEPVLESDAPPAG